MAGKSQSNLNDVTGTGKRTGNKPRTSIEASASRSPSLRTELREVDTTTLKVNEFAEAEAEASNRRRRFCQGQHWESLTDQAVYDCDDSSGNEIDLNECEPPSDDRPDQESQSVDVNKDTVTNDSVERHRFYGETAPSQCPILDSLQNVGVLYSTAGPSDGSRSNTFVHGEHGNGGQRTTRRQRLTLVRI